MSDLSGLSNIAYTANSISNLILVTPELTGIQAQKADGNSFEPSIFFNYEGENSIDLESDITDHYAEDNKYLQDQIALRPERVRVVGYIGELNDVAPSSLGAVDEKIDKLIAISGYVPELTLGALRAYNIASQASALANSLIGGDISKWGDSTRQNKQQIAYANFYGYWSERRLFTVQTPWRKFKNMAIESLRAIQDEDTQEVSSFEVTFKQMRFANEINEVEKVLIAGRASDQDQQGKGLDRGVISPVPTTATISSFIA